MKRSVITLLLTLTLAVVGTLAISAGETLARPSESAPDQSYLNLDNGRPGAPSGDDSPELSPPLITVDRVTHNQGNIITTIDNWGLIGSYHYYGLPSGEYPRNSDHDYIGEIHYWMGATNAAGDTLVANADDDFQGIPSLVTGVEQHRIFLSTDTTRYFDYDLSDTVGLGLGNPAYGWRIWDSDLGVYAYERNYSSLSAGFFDGGPRSVQESHYRFADNAQGSSLMGLEMTHTVLQWNYCYNEDFMFVILEIKNTSVEDYTDFAFGLYVDLDVGGFDGTGENGRLGDLVASDTSENLGWIYDEDGYDPGWGASVTTGVMGTKYLETPGGGGMTAFRTGDWALVPDNDPDRFELINSTDFDGSLPPTDQYYIQCTRGINLLAGQTVRVVYAIIAGDDEEDFRANAALAQELYDNYFVGPEPPPTPTLQASAGDEKVYLQWNDTAQSAVDPLSGENDFAGYKLYRSVNRGLTWGETIYSTGNNCLTLDYQPLVDYRLDRPTDPAPRSFIDSDLINGVEYWYCLVAYDTGASATGIDPLQSGFGDPDGAPNVVTVTPRNDPAGFYEAAGTVVHEYNGLAEPSSESPIPTVFDHKALKGADYEVVFEDTPQETYWHLINVTTGDTVLEDQTVFNGDPEMFPVVDGIRLVMRNADRVPRSMTQTALGGADTNLAVLNFYGPALPNFTGDTSNIYGDAHFRSTYELRYTGDSTLATSIYKYWYPSDPEVYVPFECWNTTTNERVSLAVLDFEFDEVYQPYDLLTIVNFPYDPGADLVTLGAFPYYYGWMFDFDDVLYAPTAGDVFTVEGPLMQSPEDVFAFKADGVDASDAKEELANIRVVPDPYYAFAPGWDVDEGENNIQFQNLPDECTVRIYTLAGDLIKTIEHADGTGRAWWNLQSEGQRLIASGIYIYHVESKYGDHLGRFAVVK